MQKTRLRTASGWPVVHSRPLARPTSTYVLILNKRSLIRRNGGGIVQSIRGLSTDLSYMTCIVRRSVQVRLPVPQQTSQTLQFCPQSLHLHHGHRGNGALLRARWFAARRRRRAGRGSSALPAASKLPRRFRCDSGRRGGTRRQATVGGRVATPILSCRLVAIWYDGKVVSVLGHMDFVARRAMLPVGPAPEEEHH